MAMSDYFLKLQAEYGDVAARYLNKIQDIGGVDPFILSKEDLEYSLEAFPSISQIDLISYLVLTHSYYTKEQLKAYKSLSAYKFFEAGFIEDCGSKVINNNIVVVGKVSYLNTCM